MSSRWVFWASTLAALVLPLSLLPIVGINETWEAFDRYTYQLVEFNALHQLRVPAPGDATRDYAALDADLVRWHTSLVQLYESVASMAIVGHVSSDLGVEFLWHRQAGADRRALKHDFYAPRDLSLLCYLAACVLTYAAPSVPIAVLVLVLNGVNLGVLLTDALSLSLEQLQDAQQALLALPMEGGALAVQQQALLLQKLGAMAQHWEGQQFGYSLTLPFFGSLSVSVTLMAWLAAATSVRCGHRLIKGLPAELRGLLGGRRGGSKHGKQQ